MRSSVRLWCHSRLNSPSHTSICAGNAGCVVHFIFLGSSSGDTWLFEDHTVNWSVLERQHRSLKVESQKAPPGSSFLPPFLQQKKKTPKKFCGLSLRIQTEPSEGDPVRFVRGPSDAMFLPGQSGRGTPRPSLGVKWAAAWSLDERSKGSPCRKLHRAGLYPPPGTDGTPSLVCPSASRSGAERGKSQKMSSVSSMNLFKFTMLLFF